MNDLDFKRIGSKIRETRIHKGLTQEYIASCANVNTTHISNIENNRVKVSLQTLVSICNALEVTVDYILSNEYVDNLSSLDNELIKEIHTCSLETKLLIIKIVKAIKQ